MPDIAQTVTLLSGVETALSRSQGTATSLDFMEWRELVMQVSRFASSLEISDEESLTTINDARAFEIVKLGRAFIAIDKGNRAVRQDTPAGAATLHDYQKKIALIDRELSNLGDDSIEPLWTVMGRHASKKNSFAIYKSALKWRAKCRIQ